MIDRPGSRDAAILVVDDDDAVRGLASVALRRAGYEVLEAANGRAALEMIDAGNIGVVVLDSASAS